MYIIEITEFIHSEELLQHTKTLILSRHNCDTQFPQYHTSYSLQATQIPALMMITTATVMAHSFSLGAI